MILMPGGQDTFCNDFCVDLCINTEGDDFTCDVESCLSNCGAHFSRYSHEPMMVEEGDEDDIYYEQDYGASSYHHYITMQFNI